MTMVIIIAIEVERRVVVVCGTANLATLDWVRTAIKN